MSNRFTKLLTAAVLIGAPASALASPRTLANGAPACGNTMGKGSYSDGCTTTERDAWRTQRAHERAQQQARQVAVQRKEARARAKVEQARQHMALEIALLTNDPLHRPRS